MSPRVDQAMMGMGTKLVLQGCTVLTNYILTHSLQAVKALREIGIPCRAVLDSAVGYIVDKVDMVFVGAEGVVENGGVINQVIGSHVGKLASTK